jgi:hypothetical protein
VVCCSESKGLDGMLMLVLQGSPETSWTGWIGLPYDNGFKCSTLGTLYLCIPLVQSPLLARSGESPLKDGGL